MIYQEFRYSDQYSQLSQEQLSQAKQLTIQIMRMDDLKGQPERYLEFGEAVMVEINS